jgi:hypothetical protein
VNRKASKEWHEQASMIESGTDMLQKGAQWVGSTVGSAMKRVMPGQAADSSRSRSKNGRSKRTRSRNR